MNYSSSTSSCFLARPFRPQPTIISMSFRTQNNAVSSSNESLPLGEVLAIGAARAAKANNAIPRPGMSKPKSGQPGVYGNDSAFKPKQKSKEANQLQQQLREVVQPTQDQEIKLVESMLMYIDSMPVTYGDVELNASLLSGLIMARLMSEYGFMDKAAEEDFAAHVKLLMGYLAHQHFFPTSTPFSGLDDANQMDISTVFTEEQKQQMRNRIPKDSEFMSYFEDMIAQFNEFKEAVKTAYNTHTLAAWANAINVGGKFAAKNLKLPLLSVVGVTNVWEKLSILPGAATITRLKGFANTRGWSTVTNLVGRTTDGKYNGFSRIARGAVSMDFERNEGIGMMDTLNLPWDGSGAVHVYARSWVRELWKFEYSLGPLGRMALYLILTMLAAAGKCGRENLTNIQLFLEANKPEVIAKEVKQTAIMVKEKTKKPKKPERPNGLRKKPRKPNPPKEPKAPSGQDVTDRAEAKYRKNLKTYRANVKKYEQELAEYEQKLATAERADANFKREMDQYRGKVKDIRDELKQELAILRNGLKSYRKNYTELRRFAMYKLEKDKKDEIPKTSDYIEQFRDLLKSFGPGKTVVNVIDGALGRVEGVAYFIYSKARTGKLQDINKKLQTSFDLFEEKKTQTEDIEDDEDDEEGDEEGNEYYDDDDYQGPIYLPSGEEEYDGDDLNIEGILDAGDDGDNDDDDDGAGVIPGGAPQGVIVD